MSTESEPRWLDPEQQRSWRALVLGTTLLMDRLDDELQEAFGISLAEYEIMVRLSENEGRRMRMSQLADSLAHSRSRVTHAVGRMEKSGLLRRESSPDDGRGKIACLTDRGWVLLQQAAPLHVRGVRQHLVDLCDPADFAALGRVMNQVSDALISSHPAREMR